MTLGRARELLGPEAETKTDEEILVYLQETGLLCDAIFDIVKAEISQRKIIPASLERDE